MVRVYRDLLATLQPRRGVMLDSPYGFQENVPQLTEKIVEYFASSLQVPMDVASLRRASDATPLERAEFLATIERAAFVFAGPGSPSYAMRQWRDLKVAGALGTVLDRGGVVAFASAAALTLGAKTAPIYELYKVGDDPFWLDGLDVLATFGLQCAVIPHYDNAEGGNHDTRFCYLGERRLRALESQLESDVAIFGVDEHTAVVLDGETDLLTVRGRGRAYWRRGDDVRLLGPDRPTPLDELRLRGSRSVAAAPAAAPIDQDATRSLAEVAAQGGSASLPAIAELVRRAESGGEGHIDPTALIEGVLAARAAARAAGQYATADALRDALEAGGVEVRDTPDGATWTLKGSDS